MDTLLKTKTLILHKNDFNIYGFNIINSNVINNQNFQVDIFNILSKYKNHIDNIHKDVWDKYKSLVNTFEMIFTNKKNKANVSAYLPISRAYFKMWEILCNFDLIDNSKPLNVLCLAESPGGFIEAIYNYRKKNSNQPNKALIISLKSDDNNIPNWKKGQIFFKNNPSIKISYGQDETGNLYNYKNLEFLINKYYSDKADFITADGGFDFSNDYKNQEQNSYQLIICEIIGAMGCLKKKGNFVIKIFEIFTKFTVKIIYFLTKFFETVNIYKPLSSRNLNSEKYLVCKGFTGINDQMLGSLLFVIKKWENINNTNKFVNDIFIFNVPHEFQLLIKNYNIFYTKNNIYNILKTLTYIKQNLSDTNISKIRQNQYIASALWCYKYNIGILYKSYYFNKLVNNDSYSKNQILQF